MTTEEAIKNIVAYAYYAESVPMQVGKAFDVAIAALRAQQERENPEPLTLDELRKMDGEPVWIVEIEGNRSYWAIVQRTVRYKCYDVIYMTTLEDAYDYGVSTLYGKTWLAYRHKPKEGT